MSGASDERTHEAGKSPRRAPRRLERRDLLAAGGLGLGALGLGALAGGVAEAAPPPSPAGNGPTLTLSGEGIDPSGRTPSTDRVQAVLDAAPPGAAVVVPSGSVLRITRTLSIRRRIVLQGVGELRFTAGIAHAPALHVLADGVVLRDLLISNPGELGATTGDKSFGVLIDAHDVLVQGLTLTSFQTGIAVSPFGEWRGTRIIGNAVLDVIGAGGGATSRSILGEDRGDGIVVWGAEAVVGGNQVRAKSGHDCRVGIHAENLGNYERQPGEHPDSMVSISGNVVTGAFRRGIAAEAMTSVSISGNAVADATWWAIAVIFGAACSVTGNTVLWTRTSSDLQGDSFNPARAALVLRGQGVGHVVSGNTVRIRGAVDHAIHLQSQGGGVDHAVVAGNTCSVEQGGACGSGVRADGALRSQVQGNNLSGFSGAGIACSGCQDLVVVDNGVTGTGSGTGIQLSGPGSTAQISGNRVTDVGVGLASDPGWTMAITANLFARTGQALAMEALQAAAVTGNVFQGAPVMLSGLKHPSVAVGNVELS